MHENVCYSAASITPQEIVASVEEEAYERKKIKSQTIGSTKRAKKGRVWDE